MPTPLPPITLTPGVISRTLLVNLGSIQAVKLTNGTPFDLTISGFGVRGGGGIVPAGLEYLLHAEDGNDGYLNILPVNNNNIAGTGVANIVVYGTDEQLPKGSWPATVPTQIVQAKVSTVTTLVNDGSTAGTQIVESTPAGDAGSAVSLLNTGVLVLGNATHPGSISSDNGAFATDGAGNITIANNKAYKSKDSGGTVRSLLYNDGSNNASLQAAGSNVISLRDNGGVERAKLDGTLAPARFTVEGNLAINANILLEDNGALYRLFATVDGANNDSTIYTNANHGILHIKNSAQSADIATFADTNLITALLGALNITGIQQTATGPTSGNAVITEALVGNLKILLVQCNGYANNSASDQDVTLTFPWTNGGTFWGGNIPNMGLKTSGGVKQTTNILTTLSTGAAAGVTTPETTILQNTWGFIQSLPIAKVSFLGLAGVTTRNGMFILIGQ